MTHAESVRRSASHVGHAELGRTTVFGGFSFLRGASFRTRLEPHVHCAYVLGVVDAGVVRVSLDDQTWVATPGCVIAIPPFTVHTELAGSDEGWSFRYLYPTEAVVRAALQLPAHGGPSALAFAQPVPEDEALAAAIGQAHALLEAGASGGSIRASLASLCEIARARYGVGAVLARRPRRHLGVTS